MKIEEISRRGFLKTMVAAPIVAKISPEFIANELAPKNIDIFSVLLSKVDAVSLLEVARAWIDGGASTDALTFDELTTIYNRVRKIPEYKQIADEFGPTQAVGMFINEINSSPEKISRFIGKPIAHLKVKRIIENNGSTLRDFFGDPKNVKIYSDLIKQQGLPEVGSGWDQFNKQFNPASVKQQEKSTDNDSTENTIDVPIPPGITALAGGGATAGVISKITYNLRKIFKAASELAKEKIIDPERPGEKKPEREIPALPPPQEPEVDLNRLKDLAGAGIKEPAPPKTKS